MKNNKYYIMVADDEVEIREILKLLLAEEGYQVLLAENGRQAVERFSEDLDLLLLDVNMPETTGFMAAMQIRERSNVPIIFLTAYSAESDVITGFSAGADDYIVKPFSNIELLMRIKAILRRNPSLAETPPANKSRIFFQDLILDLDNQTVLRNDEIILLTYTEFKILELLLTHRKKIYSLENIYQSVWGENPVGDSAIMVHMKNIRKKLNDSSKNSKYIKTAWGRGYYAD